MLQLIITKQTIINNIIKILENQFGIDDDLRNIDKVIITDDIRFYSGTKTNCNAVYYLSSNINKYINDVINNKVDMETKKAIANLHYKSDDQLFG